MAWLACRGGLTLSQRLEHYLPTVALLAASDRDVCVGDVAAVIGTYYSTRRPTGPFPCTPKCEKKLALERNVLRTVTDNIPDSIFAKDTEGRYLLANKAFAALHGINSPDDLLGKTAFDLFPKERATALHADDLQVMRVSAGRRGKRTNGSGPGRKREIAANDQSCP